LLKCGTAVFDALREGIKSIESLADPTVGEVRLGSVSAMTAHLVPTVFSHLAHQYPRISIHVPEMPTTAQQYRELRERNVDLVFGRIAQTSEGDIATEILFYDRIYLVGGSHNPWTRRRKVQLSQLADERWGLPPLDSPIGVSVADVFHKCGMKFPPKSVVTGSIQLISSLAELGPTLMVLPGSVLHFARGPSEHPSNQVRSSNTSLAGGNHDVEKPPPAPRCAIGHRTVPQEYRPTRLT
jgi:DNA-binding transcriptional LysR family regulator